VDPSLADLEGCVVTDVRRRGKFLIVEVAGPLLLITHLARAGWLQWRDEAPAGPPRPGKGPLALRVRFATVDGEDAGGFDLTEAGTKKGLAVWVVRSEEEVPRVASLGPEPLDDAFTTETLRELLAAAGGAQVKGMLRDQGTIAGIGNAYSDEVLHVARVSPFAPCRSVDAAALHAAIRSTLLDAVERSAGQQPALLKSEKRAGMRVHGRTGEACPVCGDVVREVSFADSSLQYCATCQTGGKPLADRRMSKLLK
jgi:formamidopyrimidine-DNA glycosylase